MDDELDTSIDSSTFDDSGSDFADTSDYNDSMDVESIMDDVPVEPIDDFADAAMDTDFSEDFTTDENVSDLMEDGVEYESSENLEANSAEIIDVDEAPYEPEEITSVNESDIDALMNNETDDSSEPAFDGDDSIIDTGTDINGDIPSNEVGEDIQPNIDELMDENADEQAENIELENDSEISESAINDTEDLTLDTDDTDDEIAADIVDIMDEAALEELDEDSQESEESINVEELMENGTENNDVDAIESSEVDINDIDENSETVDTQNTTLEDDDNLNAETDIQFEDTIETDETQKVLKRDEFELLSQGNKNINDILDVKADDYRDKGFDEDEIARKLENDKLELQQEFLNDAFPNQDVAPAVFNGFEENRIREPSINNDNSILDGNPPDGDVLDINDETNTQVDTQNDLYEESSSDTELCDTPAIHDNIVQDVSESEDIYTATPISDIQIVQQDGSVDSIENIMNRLDEETDSDEVVYDIPINETHYTTPVDETLSLQNDDLTDVEKEPSEFEDNIQGELAEIAPLENIDGWIKDVNPNFDEFDIDSPYCNNCGSCAYAVYQRLEGNPDICATAENIGYNNEMEALTGMEQVSMSPQEIEQRLIDEGNGAHAIIGIDRAEGAGHWFNAACIDGKVVAIDGQDGSVSGWPPDYGDVVNWEMSVRKETNNGQKDY